MGIKIIHTADWHLGSNRTEAADTAASIRKYLFPEIPGTDLFALVGDITDNVISLSSSSARVLSSLFIDLFFLLHEHNVAIRIVRGTILHDRDQLSFVLNILDKLPIELDVRLIDKPTVESVGAIDKTVLYIPDDLPFKSKRAMLDHIDTLLIPVGGAVDYVMCHAMFGFACSGYVIPDVLQASDFSFCREYVLAGHVHRPQIHRKVIYSGSFDRLAHNEEHKKGFFVLDPTPRFVNNPDAIPYKSVSYRSTEFDELMDEHIRFVERNFTPGSYGFLSVKLTENSLKQALRAFHIGKYPLVKITFDAKTGTASDIKASAELAALKLENPTGENLSKLVYNHMQTNGSDVEISRVVEIINGN